MTQEQERTVLSLRPTVEAAVNLFKHRTPRHLHEDLVQSAWLGAIHAVRRYDPTRNVALHTFADRRVAGEVRDFLRREDWLSREHRKRVIKGLEAPPDKLEIDASEANRELLQAPAPADDPINLISLQQILRRVYFTRQQRAILMMYLKGMSEVEVSRALGITAGLVSQIGRVMMTKMAASVGRSDNPRFPWRW